VSPRAWAAFLVAGAAFYTGLVLLALLVPAWWR